MEQPATVCGLLASFFRGNQEAYWQIWVLYDQDIYRYCLALLGNRVEDAEDAKQEVMWKGFLKLSQYQQRLTSFRSLIMSIARNTCRDILRHQQTIHWVTLQEDDCYFSQEISSEMRLIGYEEKKHLESAIAQLPPHQKYVITRYYLQGMSHPKIARMLNIKPATSRKHAEKGIKKLRKQLKK